MQIQKIFIKNFRSIGEKGLEFSLPLGSTIFIGENNVGKSSIFEAIKMMINLDVDSSIPWDAENWYKSDQNKTIEFSLNILFNDDEISKIKTFFEPINVSNEEFKKLFSNQLFYKILIKTPTDRPDSHFILGKMRIINNSGTVGDAEVVKAQYGVIWRELVNLGRIESFEKSIRDLFFLKWEESKKLEEDRIASKIDISSVQILFEKPIPKLFLNFLKENIISIDEYREKPDQELNPSLVSPTGGSLASILFNLKNGRPKDKQKFEKIREKFHKIFSNLELDVIKENDEIKIHTQKSGVESTTYFIGAGILESLLLITHIIAHKGKIIIVDHPELHLHPHAARSLAAVIDESKDMQIILITHSPYFIKIDKTHKIFRFVQENAQTKIFTLPDKFFNDIDYLKFEHLLDVDSRELFFARKVLLVEGPTEYGAIPIFAKKLWYPFDENGISIINVNGKSNFSIFAQLCESFQIPYLMLADGDAEEELRKIPIKYRREKTYILKQDFEAILPETLRQDAQKVVGNSKPRIGKYVAKEMIKTNCIPKEIKKTIDKLRSR